MRYLYFISLLFIISLFSCNTDDPSTDDNVEVSTNFFPLTANSYWNYNNQNEELGPSKDSLYIAGTEMQNGNLYTNIGTEMPANAFMSQLFSENIVRTTETQLFISGELGSPIEGLTEITIPLNDLTLYDSSVDIIEEPVIGLSTGSIIENIMEIPVEINYTVTSTMLATPTTSTEDAPQVASELRVNMEIIAMIPVGPITVPFPVLQAQDVLIAKNIYTDGLGLTSSQVVIEFALEDLTDLGVELPFPEDNSNASSQNIDTHFIGEE